MRKRVYRVTNRTVCDVLREMRSANETRNYSYLLGLIEEIQTMVNRMEAALWNQKDIEHLREEHKTLKAEVKALEEIKKFHEKP